jgi:NAD(P)-dependent dehydrogenase (short-subunit alcohol dehydrogenase family)
MLFNVNGMVAVTTGGGSGNLPIYQTQDLESNKTRYRYNDSQGHNSQRRPPHLPRRPPRIVTTSSIGSFLRFPSASIAYSSSKAAVTHMTEILATALVPYRVRCNVLALRIFPSELAMGIIGALETESEDEIYGSDVPAGRTEKEDDIAG